MRLSCPNGFLSGSDAHAEPLQGMPESWREMCRYARKIDVPVVANGDMFDAIIWGWREYHCSHAVRTFMRSADNLDAYIIVGNHEGKAKWIRRLFHACPNCHVVTHLDVRVNGRRWLIEHGDRFALDWGRIGWLYRSVAYAMLSFAPKLWFRMMKRWRPGPMKPPHGHESEKYNKLTGYIWMRALNEAVRRRANIIIGHTHTQAQTAKQGTVLLDGGDLRDGSTVYVNPNGQGSIRWFGGNV